VKRLIFIDIDGTLISPGSSVSHADAEAISEALDAQCEVILCTGRSRFSTQYVLNQLDPRLGFVICSNGAIIMRNNPSDVMFRRLISPAVAVKAIDEFLSLQLTPYIYEEATTVDCARALYPFDMPIDGWAKPPRYQPYDRYAGELPFSPVSVGAFGVRDKIHTVAERLRTNLPPTLTVEISGAQGQAGVQVHAAGVCKEFGMQYLAEHLGVSAAFAMAIGDHINDIGMLKWAGTGVAMANGEADLIGQADWVTSDVQDSGVAKAIERFLTTEFDKSTSQ
jgi:hypothetical protein